MVLSKSPMKMKNQMKIFKKYQSMDMNDRIQAKRNFWQTAILLSKNLL